MNLLSFTTSTDSGSVAVMKGDRIFKKSWNRTTQHSETLTLAIQSTLKKASLKPLALDVIAVDKGPGSFTGARMAVNVAKTMSYILNIPIFAETSLRILAEGAAPLHKGPIFCLLNAHKALLYAQLFISNENNEIELVHGSPWEKPRALPLTDILSQIDEKTLVIGDIPPTDFSQIREKGSRLIKKASLQTPQAAVLAQMAKRNNRQNAAAFVTWSKVEPSYIRVPDVVEKFLSNSAT